MKIRNCRPYAVEIAPPDGRSYQVKGGATVEVPDEIGASLTAQVDAWVEVKSQTKAEQATQKGEE